MDFDTEFVKLIREIHRGFYVSCMLDEAVDNVMTIGREAGMSNNLIQESLTILTSFRGV